MRLAALAVHAVVGLAVPLTAAAATLAAAAPPPWRLTVLAAETGLILACTLGALHLALARLRGEERARWAAEHDALTRLLNRPQMTLALDRARRTGRREPRPLAVVIVDVDRLAAVNETFNPAVGDRVLAEVGDACRRAARPGDLWGRWEGDAFLGLLPAADGRTARLLAEQVRAAVARSTVATREGEAVGVTVSGGVAVAGTSRESADDLVDAAERALYAAKRAGGDRIKTATRPAATPALDPAPAPA